MKMRISSRYTITKDLVNGHKILSIFLVKFDGVLVKFKGMANHSKRPSLDLNVIFHVSIYSIHA
jgi:hypothetical protein